MTKLPLFMILLVALYACGRAPEETSVVVPADPQFDAVKGLVDASCNDCHNFQSAAQFKTADVKRRIANGNMPQGRVLDPADKTTLLTYLGQ